MRYWSLFLFIFLNILSCKGEVKVENNISFPEPTPQIFNPVKWEYKVEQKGDEATLLFIAHIDKGWHLYSQDIPPDGPIPTTFNIEKSKLFDLIGKVSEGEAEVVFDPNFDMVLKYFSNQAVFRQKIKVKSEKDFTISGFLEFMVCDDEKCLPPDERDFAFKIKGTPQKTTDVGSAVTPADKTRDETLEKDTASGVVSPADAGNVDRMDRQVETAEISTIPVDAQKRNLWGIFIGGFFGGLLALLTPCVFPMLPLTVSYFTKKSGTKGKAVANAGIYGLSIIFIYVALGYMITLFLGPDALNALASSAFFNLLFFVLFVVFAASFFGAFEINLPSSWVNSVDKQSERGGLIGIFFMAFTLALVSFSCTGPIIGTLLVEAAMGQSVMGPVAGMMGFSVALAIPFALFAAFPSWLSSLPRSGGWLNSVKVVLGFLELALAMKFLSNADLAYHWGILDREVFLVIWIVLFTMLGFYLLGKLKFPHDSDSDRISITRLFLSIVSFSFALYMIPGLWGAPLKAISAFSPPQATQDFDLYTINLNKGSGTYNPSSPGSTEPKKYADLLHCPLNLDCYFDYEEGMAHAAKMNKPVLIDFTGHSCVNCRKMEVSVWSDPMVLQRLRDNYVLISLYVDDKTKLPEEEQYISEIFEGKRIRTIGNKWSDFQTSRFKTNSQPYYVLLDNDGNLLVEPQDYNLNIRNYVNFLDRGIVEFNKRQRLASQR
jgi:thiol:disulfide interchange protein